MMSVPTIPRETLIAGVLDATDRLVSHVGRGDWQSANQTAADRRVLLDELAKQGGKPEEHGFLKALRQAAVESEAALDAMRHGSVKPR
jgi:hypothetical protein